MFFDLYVLNFGEKIRKELQFVLQKYRENDEKNINPGVEFKLSNA